ncbi:MAG: CDP-alcohol phosphatidyltransferase family protein [Pseudohongiellaceae bacterium]
MANLLTGIRLLLIFPLTWEFARPGFMSPWLLLLLLGVAIATDYFDGVVARRTNTASAAGQLFDHSTDFLLVTSGLAGLAWAGLITPILPPLIVIAFSQYVLDSHFLYRQKNLRMSYIGRWNGIFYFVPLCLIAFSRLELLSAVADLLETLALIIAWLLVLTTIISIIDRAIAPLRHKTEKT